MAEPARSGDRDLAELDCGDRGQRAADSPPTQRLSLYSGNSAEFWLNVQTRYDLTVERQQLSSEAVERHTALPRVRVL